MRLKHRLIIDTNLWISFLLTNDYTKFDRIFKQQNAVLVFNEQLLNEFINVAQRPKFRRYFSLMEIESILLKIRPISIYVSTTTQIELCRDAKDNFLLSLATDGNATHLLTGDNDLLVLKRIGKTKIVTISEYIETYCAK